MEKPKLKIIVVIDGEIDELKRAQILETLKQNIKMYSFLGAHVEAELLG